MSDSFKDNLLEEAMNKFGNEVLYIVYSYVKDYSLAEDITQDVFVKVYNKLDTFREESSLKTWVINIAVNHCRDYFRKWETRKLIFTNKISELMKGNSNSIESLIIQKEIKDELVKSVFNLPIKYREVIILYYFEELKLIEVSECLSININTVKTRLTKAKKMLNEKYPLGGENIG
jgi:RNA polymerase sigma-70 factor, ECF subfamily